MFLDKLRLIDGDKGGMYMFDRDLENSAIQPTNPSGPTA
jgi:ferritin